MNSNLVLAKNLPFQIMAIASLADYPVEITIPGSCNKKFRIQPHGYTFVNCEINDGSMDIIKSEFLVSPVDSNNLVRPKATSFRLTLASPEAYELELQNPGKESDTSYIFRFGDKAYTSLGISQNLWVSSQTME